MGSGRKRAKRAIMCRKERDTSRGSPGSFAAQKTRAQDDKPLLPIARGAPANRGEGDGAEQTQVVHPPQTSPGLGPPRTLERGVGTAFPT